MSIHHNTPDEGDPSCPRCFTVDEWQATVRFLKLSPRQAQIVGYLMQSMSRETIQRILNITPSSFRTHYDRARAKLRAQDMMEMSVCVFVAFRNLFYPKPPSQ